MQQLVQCSAPLPTMHGDLGATGTVQSTWGQVSLQDQYPEYVLLLSDLVPIYPDLALSLPHTVTRLLHLPSPAPFIASNCLIVSSVSRFEGKKLHGTDKYPGQAYFQQTLATPNLRRRLVPSRLPDDYQGSIDTLKASRSRSASLLGQAALDRLFSEQHYVPISNIRFRSIRL